METPFDRLRTSKHMSDIESTIGIDRSSRIDIEDITIFTFVRSSLL